MKRTTAVLLLLFALSGTAQGQLRENVYFHQLTQQKGLLQEYNWYIFTDSKGLVWISSTHGLARFDGIQIKSYLPNARDTNELRGIHVMGDFAESSDGNIWFAADNYLCKYVREKDNFVHFQVHNARGNPLTGYYRLLTQDSEGNLWVLIDDKRIGSPVYKFHIDPITQKFEFKLVCNMGVSANRCYAIKNKGLVTGLFAFQYDENVGHLQQVLPSPKAAEPIYFKLPNLKKKGTLLDALDLNDGRFYVLTDAGLFLNDLNAASPQCVFTEKNITSITKDANGLLYLGTGAGQVIQLNPEQQYKVIHRFKTRQQVTHNDAYISHLYIDPDTTLWISYYYTGVAWVNLHKTKFNTLVQKDNDKVISLLRDAQGQIWGIQGRSIVKIDNAGKKVASYQAPNCAYDFEKISTVDQHSIGLISYGEIYIFDLLDHRFYQIDQFLDSQIGFLDLVALDGQTLLAGTAYYGLFMYKKQDNGKYLRQRISGYIDSLSYTDLYRDQNGRVYIYKEATDLLIYNYVQGHLNRLSDPIQFKADITSWAEDADFVWVGTNLGLLQIDKRNQHHRFFTQSDGLPGLNVSNLVIDPAHGIWMHVNSRLVYFKDGRARVFSKADGASESMHSVGSATLDARGVIWALAKEGLVIAKNNATVPLNGKAKPFVNAIFINEQQDPTLRCALTGNANPNDIQKIVLDFDKRNLKISFLAIEFADPENNYLEYQIVGVDTNWIRTPNPGFARFLGIREGEYHLYIRAYSSDGILNPEIKEITVVIKPPFVRSNFFYILLILLGTFVVGGVFYLRHRQDNIMQAMRQQIADDLHDEVGSVLTGIHMFSETLKRMINIQDREANYLLGRIGTNAQKTLSSFRDIVWAINPKYDRLEQLMYRMRLVVAETSDASNIKCSFDTSIQGQTQTKLNPQIRHNIFLIFKEALNNAVKYSKATQIDIKLEVNDRHLTLEVTDNGQGFDMEAPASGNGLSNLKKRANALNGIFKFNSALGKGTQLFLQISLKSRRIA